MFSHGITASSSSSSTAINAAIAEASSDFGGEAKSVHIIVTRIIEINGVWVANVLVLVSPDLDKDLDEEEKLEHEGQHLKQENNEDLDIEYETLDFGYEDGMGVHVYFPIELEEYMHDFEHYMSIDPKVAQSHDFYFHLIDEGPLWDAVQQHPLDIEFYEATHSAELRLCQENDNRKFQENMKAPRLQKKMRGALQDFELDS